MGLTKMVYTIRCYFSGNNRDQKIERFNSCRLYYFCYERHRQTLLFFWAERLVRRLPLAALPHTAFIQERSAHTDDCHWLGGEHRGRCFHLSAPLPIIRVHNADLLKILHWAMPLFTSECSPRAETVMCRLPSL